MSGVWQQFPHSHTPDVPDDVLRREMRIIHAELCLSRVPPPPCAVDDPFPGAASPAARRRRIWGGSGNPHRESADLVGCAGEPRACELGCDGH
jgi:hypothetical protein